jgi:dTMP kinase
LQLVENLKKAGVNAVHIRFPTTDTDIGKTIRLFLTNKIELDKRSIYLLFAADRWQQQKAIQQLLDEDKTVVCDRYSPSGIAFGAASGLDLEWCKKIEEGMIQPDILYYLSLPIEVAEQRGGFGKKKDLTFYLNCF